MKKLIFILFLFLTPCLAFSYNNQQQDFNVEKFNKDIDSINNKMNRSFHTAGEVASILHKEVKMIGLKKTIQLNFDIFFPIVIFIILYLVWLKNRKK